VPEEDEEMINNPRRIVWLVLALLLAAGCGRVTPQARFYLLSPIVESQTAEQGNDSAAGALIGIGPVKIPEYLRRPQIVTRRGDNELAVAEFDRWAGSLKEDINRVMAENIAGTPGGAQVVVYPWRRTMPVDYQVELEILNFDGSLGGGVSLQSRWTIYKNVSKEVLAVKTSRLTETASGPGYGDFVAGQSRLLKRLSDEISLELLKVMEKK